MKKIHSAVLTLLALAPVGLAQQVTYSTNFDDTSDFPSGYTVASYTTAELPANNSNQDLDWITNNVNEDSTPTAYPTDSILPDSSSYAEYAGDQWAIMGGAVGLNPSQSEVELWNPVSISNSFNFSMEFAVTESSGAYTNNDAFGVTFRNTANGAGAPTSDGVGDLLLQILFTPDSGNPSSELDVDWNTGGSENSADLEIARDAKYDIQVTGNLTAGTFQAVISSVGVSSSGTFDGTFESGQSLGAAAVTWDILDSGSPGNNSILFNNYSVVPEPSVYMSFLLGCGGLICWRGRKRFIR